jgi:acyl transferase domain-containing protein
MGRQLYETQPIFRQALDKCNELLLPYLEQPLLSVLYSEQAESSLLDETAYTQPALFALEYALAELWRSWGVTPAIVMGHSVGEYVAACLAGVFSLEDGLKLIAERGRLMQALPAGGEMAAIFAGEAEVLAAITPYSDRVSIAAVNGPENVVISGAGAAIQTILESLAAQGIKARSLTVSHAFHSPLMEPMLADFARVAASVSYAAPQIGLVSNITGKLAGQEIANSAYWQQHVRAPVQFASAIQTLHEQG